MRLSLQSVLQGSREDLEKFAFAEFQRRMQSSHGVPVRTGWPCRPGSTRRGRPRWVTTPEPTRQPEAK